MSLGSCLGIEVMAVLSALAVSACAPTVADGAQRVFSTTQICRADAVSVKARPDLAPHAVLEGVSPPPGLDLDAVGGTYELSGCNRKLLYVCAHPIVGNHPDAFSAAITQGEFGTEVSLNTEYFALTRALETSGGRVTSAVVCQPGTASLQ